MSLFYLQQMQYRLADNSLLTICSSTISNKNNYCILITTDRSSSTQVVVGTEGILLLFDPHCHHRMGCLCEVWSPKCPLPCIIAICNNFLGHQELEHGLLIDHLPIAPGILKLCWWFHQFWCWSNDVQIKLVFFLWYGQSSACWPGTIVMSNNFFSQQEMEHGLLIFHLPIAPGILKLLVVPPFQMLVPWHFYQIGFLSVVWGPKHHLLARCHIHVTWFLLFAGSGM